MTASRNRARLRKRLVAAAALFILVLGIAATWASVKAYRAGQLAEEVFGLAKSSMQEMSQYQQTESNRLNEADTVAKNEIRLISLERSGDVLVGQGKLEEALKVYRDSLAIRERLAAERSPPITTNTVYRWRTSR